MSVLTVPLARYDASMNMLNGPSFSTVGSAAELRTLYRAPSSLVAAKVKVGFDPATLAFIAQSPFALVGSCSVDGALDVSPRGGPPGFVSVVDDASGQSFAVLPDLNGNNLLDTFTNVAANGRVGMLFFVPGQGESLRVNGAAWVSADSELLAQCTPPDFATPKAALVVRPDQVFIHCAKAFKRSGLWDPSTWSPDQAPDGIDILASQGLVPADQVNEVRATLMAGYVTELAQDLQGPT
jgi:uncharacterized protein